MKNRNDQGLRISVAVNALDAVRDLCMEAGGHSLGNTLGHVGADNFASLLDLIICEVRDAMAVDDDNALPCHDGRQSRSSRFA